MSLELLILEDNPDDADLIVRELRKSGLGFGWNRVDTVKGFTEGLESRPDLIIADHSIPSIDAIHALELWDKGFRDIPVIVISGRVGEERAASCIKSGATDFLLKENLDRLPHAVERALRESRVREEVRVAEARYRDLVESLPAIVYTAAPGARGEWTYVSPQVQTFLGYAPEEWQSCPDVWLSCIHPDDLDRVVAVEEEVLQSGTGTVCEYRMLARSGDMVWVRDQSTLVTNEDGDPVLKGFIFDITDRKLMEKALAESERRFRTIYDGAALGIAILDLDGAFASTNPALDDMLGYAPGDLVGINFADLTHPADLERELELFKKGGKGIGVYHMEKRYFRRDGRIIWGDLTARLVRDETGAPSFWIGIIQNITSKKDSERARERLVALLEATPDLVGMADADGTLLYLNPAGRRLLEIPADENITKLNTGAIQTPEGREFAMKVARPTALLSGSWSGEGDFLTRSGKVLPMSQVVVAHKGPDEQAELYSTISRDLSQQKELEGQLLQSQKMEAIGSLAGGVAHDFNNLLAVIINYANFVLEELEITDPRYEDVREIEKAGERGAKLVRQLLAFSRREIVSPEVLNLNDVVSDMERLLKPTIGEDIKLEFKPEPDAWMTLMDPGQLEQIVMNLAVNARDAMPAGGRLTLTTCNIVVQKGAVPDLSAGNYVCLTVTDSGHGMDDNLVERIFEPFFTTKPRGSGTGLGLATVYGIVHQSGGAVQVDSRPGKGTSFSVYLPAATDASTEHPLLLPAAGSAPGSGRCAVLLVEDDGPVRRVVTRMLDQHGFEVLAAASGEEALKIWASHEDSIDLLLTDVVMPEMSGKLLSKMLAPAGHRVRTLFMSGYADKIVGTEGVLDRGETLIQKPFSARELLSKIDEALAA